MRRDLLVYLSGPITARHGVSIEANVAAGVDAFLACLRLGIPAFCPHLVAAFPSASAVPWDRWLDYDCAVIDRCTHVLMLPRWETSVGALRERGYAGLRGIPVIYDLDALPAAPIEAAS